MMAIIQAAVDFLGPWSWWVLGLVLFGLEILAPGTFFLWFGIAALVVGTISLFIAWSWQVQAVVFVVLAVVALVAGRILLRGKGTVVGADELKLNQRGVRLVGRRYVLAEPLANGAGHLRIDDTIWRITGPDLPAGTRVEVLSADGALLTVGVVEPAPAA